jgi:D-alanyl-lipoteichoic acid acyltransferase DltB (MBOAT superfamily)
MTFTTLTFILYLPVVFALYWTVQRQHARNLVILFASYVFYAWWDYRFCALMLATNLVDYGVARGLARVDDPRGRRGLLFVSLAFNLGVLGFFKYYNFFIESLTSALGNVGWTIHPFTLSIVLPAGVSFYTFQALSYTIDVYKRRLEPSRSLIAHLAYVSFFPTLVAGPIERGTELLPQLSSPRVFEYDKAVRGLRLIGWGFFKKLAIADQLAAIVEASYSAPELATGPSLTFATVCFAFQIYCDFSAYSDIARGTAWLFGVDVMRNFDSPYFSQSIGEFWRRWHISLSTWFRDYVYIPLGGSRVGSVRRSWNLLLTFLVSGIWHGAAWTFVVWGILHGVSMVFGSWLGRREPRPAQTCAGGEATVPSLGTLGRMVRTFAIVNVFWVFFRAESVSDAVLILQTIVMDAFRPSAYLPLIETVTEDPLRQLSLIVLGLFILTEWLIRDREHPLVLDGWPRSLRYATYTACLWLTLALTARRTGEFIYFQF